MHDMVPCTAELRDALQGMAPLLLPLLHMVPLQDGAHAPQDVAPLHLPCCMP